MTCCITPRTAIDYTNVNKVCPDAILAMRSYASVARAGEPSLFDAAGLTACCADGWMQADNLSGANWVRVDEPLR